jgi:pyruvate dehydrogenase E2 component (dihydrolipoamide acetyltransferase)
MKNIKLGRPLRLSAWRKIALGSWPGIGDPSIYGLVELDAGPALEYLERLRDSSRSRVTLTHLVGRAMAEVVRRHPEINVVLRWGKLYPRKAVDVFFMVATDRRGDDLTGAIVRDADKKDIGTIARELDGSVSAIRSGGDLGFSGFKRLSRLLPALLMRPAIAVAQLFMYHLNYWRPWLGVPRDAFGSVMITNIGSLGLDAAFAALVPYSRAPMIVAVSALQEAPVARDGKVVVVQQLRLGVTIDHRVIDGMQASHMARTLKAVFAEPEKFLTGGASR